MGDGRSWEMEAEKIIEDRELVVGNGKQVQDNKQKQTEVK